MEPVTQPTQTVTKQKAKKLPSKLEMASHAPEPKGGNRESADLLKEIEGLKNMIKSLQVYSSDRKYPGKLQKIHEYLTEQEVDISLRYQKWTAWKKRFVFKPRSTDEGGSSLFGRIHVRDIGKSRKWKNRAAFDLEGKRHAANSNEDKVTETLKQETNNAFAIGIVNKSEMGVNNPTWSTSETFMIFFFISSPDSDVTIVTINLSTSFALKLGVSELAMFCEMTFCLALE
jgi:hypothetical protein